MILQGGSGLPVPPLGLPMNITPQISPQAWSWIDTEDQNHKPHCYNMGQHMRFWYSSPRRPAEAQIIKIKPTYLPTCQTEPSLLANLEGTWTYAQTKFLAFSPTLWLCIHALKLFACEEFCHLLIFFEIIFFFKFFHEYHQCVKQFGVRSGRTLCPNCLQMLSADGKSHHKQIKELFVCAAAQQFWSYLDTLLSSWFEPELSRTNIFTWF